MGYAGKAGDTLRYGTVHASLTSPNGQLGLARDALETALVRAQELPGYERNGDADGDAKSDTDDRQQGS